ncbi:MAG: transferase [Peptococcaceae bacterium BRH_c4a]|nr:MAG: transferase [Peptococcaceae bacterium BRH_c4a]
MRVVEIYDTTLRDGAQGEGISFSVEDKIKIALKLDKMGLHYIEGGWPGSNPKDMEFFHKMAQQPIKNSRIAAFGSTRRPNIEARDDANLNSILESGVQVATLVGKTWDFHVIHALNTTLEENLAMIRESVAFLKGRGLSVIYDAEHFFDGYKANPQYALATLEAAAAGGACTLVLCDTNGGTLPNEICDVVVMAGERFRAPLGIHCHNDVDMAVASSIMAVMAGASHVQGTVNGYGERCGNANLCSIIPNLTLKCGAETIPRENFRRLTELSRYVSEVANMHPVSGQPYVGSSAFAHKGGIHVSAIVKSSRTYEHIDPDLVGNRRRVLMSELSGLSNLLYKYKEMNLDLELAKEENRELLDRIKEMENEGYQFEGAEGSFELMLRKLKAGYREPFKLESLRIITEMSDDKPSNSQSVIKISVGDKVVHTAAEGSGPVNALDNALRKALDQFYPCIRSMQLSDYKVRVLEEKDGTGAAVRVLIETGDGKRNWGTVGVSENIIEASWKALVDSIAFGLLKNQESPPEEKEQV